MTYLSHYKFCNYRDDLINIFPFKKYFGEYNPNGKDSNKDSIHTLDTVIKTFEIPKMIYKEKKDISNYLISDYFPIKKYGYFTPYIFLKEHRPLTQFIGDASEVKLLVGEIFREVVKKELPANIIFTLCGIEQFKETHRKYNGIWSNSIMGFCINRNPFISSIFVRKGNLDSVIVTLGHEIGHTLTINLGNQLDEEAKAFAFCLAWLESIKKNDFGNLGSAIEIEKPASNGLHNTALEFVKEQINKGKSPIGVFYELKAGKISILKNNFLKL